MSRDLKEHKYSILHSKWWTLLDCDYLYRLSVIPKATIETFLQVDTLRNNLHKSKWNCIKIQVTNRKIERKKWTQETNLKNKMSNSSSNIPIITLNVNDINTVTKRQRLAADLKT